MDRSHSELVQRLFTLATEILEDTVETAVAGQSSKRSIKLYALYARELSTTGAGLTAIGDAICAALRHDREVTAHMKQRRRARNLPRKSGH